jgi:acyl transferase domain-containing protein/acyl carrier protein
MYDYRQNEKEGIAVIGMAGRFPGAENLEQYWHNICNGVESISYFSDDEVLKSGIDRELIKKSNFIKARGVLDDTDLIDARLFGLHAREAALMDPQHRLFLECAWKAFESAGYCPDNHQGRVGVFGGSSMNTYMLNNLADLIKNIESVESLQISIGNDKDSLTTEVAYRLNLKGPAVTIQSSSSTSLTAVHYACQSLLNYESNMALAGGVSIHFPEKSGYLYMEGGTTSSDGHCRTFDVAADGFVAGHGVGVVLLKRVADALADGDEIWAVIKGSAVNNDGAVRVSYMAPGVEGQSKVFAMAQAIAGVEPGDIGYIEAHGTGTKVGDPIEMASLRQVFRAVTNKKNFCAIGSVKPNIGHLDSAAGIAGFIKTVLMLKYQKLPPQINFREPNPELDLENSPFYINTELRDWESVYRIAGVNSFGMGGTNAHVIMAEPPKVSPSHHQKSAVLLVLSAKTEQALDTVTRNLACYLEANPQLNLNDVSYTLYTGRKKFEYRRTLVCEDHHDAVQMLKEPAPGRVFTDGTEGVEKRLLFFLFPADLAFGGKSLGTLISDINREVPLFKSHLDACLECVNSFLTTDTDLKEIFYGPAQERVGTSLLETKEKTLTPLVLFIIEYAFTQVLLDWGLKPQGILGQGVGEYVAACVSGVMSLQDALNLVMQINNLGNHLCPIKLSSLKEPVIPFLSGQSGNWTTKEEATDPLYWQQQHQGFRLPERVKGLLADSPAIILEVSPGAESMDEIKQIMMAQELASKQHLVLSCIPQGHPYRTAYAAFLETVGRLWLAGCNPEGEKLYQGEGSICRRIPLPTYPFEYKSHWIQPTRTDKKGVEAEIQLGNQKKALKDWFYVPDWKREDWNGGADLVKRDSPYWIFIPEQLEDNGEKVESLLHQCMRVFKEQNSQTIVISCGRSYAKLAPDHYQINSLVYADYEMLSEDLNRSDLLPGNIVDFRSLTLMERGDAHSERVGFLDDCLAHGFHSVLFLVKALEKYHLRKDLLLTVVSCRTLDVSGAEPISPEKATLIGACKVIPQEYSIVCHYLDIVAPTPGSAQEKQLVTQLTQAVMFDKAASGVTIENQVAAYRGGQRFLWALEAVKPLIGPGHQSLVKVGGVYLILGGLGTIGYCFAKSLARYGRVRLAIVGSTPLPEEEQWNDWLVAHGEDEATSLKIKKLQALQKMDCEVVYIKADLLNVEQMKEVLRDIKTRFAKLDGVIDAAGTVNDQIFKPIRCTDCSATIHEPSSNLKTKWQGLYVLEEVLTEERLDFCLLCSSLSALLGGLGLAEYAAGNLFMDAFVARCNQVSGSSWISVNWDAFAATSRQYRDFGTPLLDLAITAEEAEEVAIRLLTNYPLRSQYLISTSDLFERYQKWTAAGRQDLSPVLAGEQTAKKEKNVSMDTSLPRPALQNSYIAPQTKLEKELAKVWAKVLGLQSVGIQDNFFELGGNSLVGIELISQIKDLYDCEISSVDIYESPTIKMLSELIESREQGVSKDQEKARQSYNRGEKRRERILGHQQ